MPDSPVPLDLLAEDVDAFAAWDADNLPPRDDANIQLNLRVHLGLLARLKSLDDMPVQASMAAQYERGQAVLGVIRELHGVAARLTELGHTGAEANAALYEQAAEMCRAGLADIENQMKNPGLVELAAPIKAAGPIPAPRPSPWEKQKGPRPWLNNRK